MVGLAISALISAGLGWLVARSGLKPVAQVTQVAASMSAGSLKERIPMDSVPREMELLVTSLNAMLARLEESFARLSNFSADIAHELRTPISSLRTYNVNRPGCRSSPAHQPLPITTLLASLTHKGIRPAKSSIQPSEQLGSHCSEALIHLRHISTMVTEFGQVITLIDLIMVELGTAFQADLGGAVAQAKHAERIAVNVRVVCASRAGRYRRFTTFGCSVIKVGVVVHGHDDLRRFFVSRNSPATGALKRRSRRGSYWCSRLDQLRMTRRAVQECRRARE